MEAVTATALLVAAMATVPTARRVTQLATRGLPLAFRSQPSCAASCTSCPPSYPSSVADLVASSVAPRHRLFHHTNCALCSCADSGGC
jgi:hypothetical protein